MLSPGWVRLFEPCPSWVEALRVLPRQAEIVLAASERDRGLEWVATVGCTVVECRSRCVFHRFAQGSCPGIVIIDQIKGKM